MIFSNPVLLTNPHSKAKSGLFPSMCIHLANPQNVFIKHKHTLTANPHLESKIRHITFQYLKHVQYVKPLKNINLLTFLVYTGSIPYPTFPFYIAQSVPPTFLSSDSFFAVSSPQSASLFLLPSL